MTVGVPDVDTLPLGFDDAAADVWLPLELEAEEDEELDVRPLRALRESSSKSSSSTPAVSSSSSSPGSVAVVVVSAVATMTEAGWARIIQQNRRE